MNLSQLKPRTSTAYDRKCHERRKEIDRITAARLSTADRYPIIYSSTPPLPPPTSHNFPREQPFPTQQIVKMPPKSNPPSLPKTGMLCRAHRPQQIETQPQQLQSFDPALIRDHKLALSVIQAKWTHQKIAKKIKIKDAPP